MRALFLIAAFTIITAGGAAALTGREDEAELGARLDRYATLVQTGGPTERGEAKTILEGLSKLLKAPVYPGGARFNHDPKMGDEKDLPHQVSDLKTLLGSMMAARRGALGAASAYSEVQKKQIRQGYMGDRETALKLLRAMGTALEELSETANRPTAGAALRKP